MPPLRYWITRNLLNRTLLTAANLVDSNIILLIQLIILIECHLPIVLQCILAEFVKDPAHGLANLFKIVLIVFVQLAQEAVHYFFGFGVRNLLRLLPGKWNGILFDGCHGTHWLQKLIDAVVVLIK